MIWIAPAPSPVDERLSGADRPILRGYLQFQRVTLLNICAGLTAEQLATRPVASSTLSLLGLIRHLAKVERIWFRQRVAGEPVAPMYDPARGKDTDFDEAKAEDAPVDFQRLRDEWRLADAAVADIGFDETVVVNGDVYSLRMVYVHLIAEYARHNGHADLLRQSIGGIAGR